jgi:hypothetical protein
MLDMAGVGVSLAGQPTHASTPIAHVLEQTQYVLGEGPMLDAYRTRLPVEVVGIPPGDSAGWLQLDFAARGIGTVLAFPLMVGHTCLGAMTLYRRRAIDLDFEQRALVLVVADQAAVGIGSLIVSSRLTPLRHPALGGLDELRQAIGIVMGQLRVSAEEASARLRAHAYQSARSLDDVVSGLRNHTIQLASDFSDQPDGG